MMRLLVAEDERVTREAICRMIDWESSGIELVGACSNGLEAYDMILDESPDIVLTDIRMPELDGLGLVQRVRETEPDIQFVIISGYNEFEYAKTAIKYGVCEYLLKPCDEDEILKALLQAASKVEQNRATRRMLQERQWMASQFGAEIRRRFAEEIISGDGEIEENIKKLGKLLHFPEGKYCLCGVSFLEKHLLKSFAVQTSGMPERFRMSKCLDTIYVTNTALLPLCVTENSDKAAFDRELDALKPDGAAVKLFVWTEEYSGPAEMFAALVKKVRRYARVLLVDGDGEAHEIVNRTAAKKFILDAIEYVEEHYGDTRLSMKWLAENHLFMNADYLNRQFVQATGEKFSAYLGRVRVEKAKELIARYDSVYEVAELVGCGNNPQYFSQLFKKWAGCTPSQYRDSNNHN